MKCPNCGHENPDIRLFCASCGAELPEFAETVIAASPSADSFARPAAENDVSAQFSPLDENEEPEFVPLLQDEDTLPIPEQEPHFTEMDFEQTAPVSDNVYARPGVREVPAKPVLHRQETADTIRSKTHIPKRDEKLDPDEFFAVRGQVLPEYDEEHDERHKRKRHADEFEDSAPQSFAVRHMRGIVTMALLLLTAIIVLIWSNTENAQLALARLDIAWKAEAYNTLGDESYGNEDLSAAGYYYTAALDREKDNFNYAIKAANSYIEGGFNSNAVAALRRCIALQPSNVELYIRLAELSGGYENLSEDDRQLVDKGYALTQDERLNMK